MPSSYRLVFKLFFQLLIIHASNFKVFFFGCRHSICFQNPCTCLPVRRSHACTGILNSPSVLNKQKNEISNRLPAKFLKNLRKKCFHIIPRCAVCAGIICYRYIKLFAGLGCFRICKCMYRVRI